MFVFLRRSARPRDWSAALLLMCASLLCGGVQAQVASSPDYETLAQDWLREATKSVQLDPGSTLRVEVKVGNLDSRLRLAPCGNVEPYLPPGSRLWGRTRIGLRCVDGVSRWNVSLPVTVNAFGTAWVIKGTVQPGAVLVQDDVVEAEVNWAEESSPVIRDRSLWVGQTATRLLTSGQTLRQGMAKPAQVFQAGAQVRVVAQGQGFQISSDAQALSAGVVGQVARVRMENGRVSSGTVLDIRTVKIDL
jgi:flagella basal body P-ring formation protein FlgA